MGGLGYGRRRAARSGSGVDARRVAVLGDLGLGRGVGSGYDGAGDDLWAARGVLRHGRACVLGEVDQVPLAALAFGGDPLERVVEVGEVLVVTRIDRCPPRRKRGLFRAVGGIDVMEVGGPAA